MFTGNQRTIANNVSFSGRISNENCNESTVTFLPAEINTGIVFRRTDLKQNNEIKAIYSNIKKDDHFRITLANKSGVEVFNVEHIMSAIWGRGLDNLIVEVCCADIPIIDGSTEPLLFLLTSAGLELSEEPRKILEIKKEIKVSDKDGEISIKPSRAFAVNMQMNLKSGEKLNESFLFDHSISPYKDSVSRARSFYLDSNAKVIPKTHYRHSSEFAKHEILDCIGGLYLSGHFVIAEVNGINGNYNLYNALLAKIFESEDNYCLV